MAPTATTTMLASDEKADGTALEEKQPNTRPFEQRSHARGGLSLMASRSRVAADLSLGSRVTVTGKKGVVKFVGTTEFAAGEWIGVELDAPEGKNNGTVNNVQYFDARPEHGLFVKKAQVRLDRAFNATASDPSGTPRARPSSAPSASPASAGVGRASSRLAAIREKNKALKESLAAGKTSPRVTRRGPGTYSSRSQPVDAGLTQEDVGTPSSPRSIVSIGSVTSDRRAQGLESIAGIPPAVKAVLDAHEPLASGQPSQASGTPLRETSEDMDMLRSSAAQATRMAEEANARLAETTSRLKESEDSCRDLEGKLTLLLKKSENALGEERSRASAVAKEKAAAAAAGRREADLEAQIAELTDTCEALTLDKEQIALEKEDLQEKMDELHTELDSIKLDLEHAQISAKENEAAARTLSAAGGSSGSGGIDVKMLAEQNLQLKEALKRLHAHSNAEKTNLTKSVRALQKEVASVNPLKEEVDKLRSWKLIKALEIEDLMEKLDESKAYEEMVEALTEKNLEIGERCGELEATIADLESSVELSEELEVRQAEEIRELQGELTSRDVSLHNQKLALEAVLKELEGTKKTINQFREYANELKNARDHLAAAATDGGDSASTNEKKRALLTHKASLQKLAADTRRSKIAERLLEMGLLDAQARSSRVSMLLPGSLVLAEAELRNTDVDLSLCRLVGKLSLALELLESSAFDFVDSLVASSAVRSEDDDASDRPTAFTLDRATAIEACSRLAQEAQESLPLAQAAGQALAVLGTTVLAAHGELPSKGVAAVNAEVGSAVIEAEGLVDDLLKIIQMDGGLTPSGSASTVSSLAATGKSIGARCIAAMASAATHVLADEAFAQGATDSPNMGTAIGALQECLVCARQAVLSTTYATLQAADGPHVDSSLFAKRETDKPDLFDSVRGLCQDLTVLRSAADSAAEDWSADLMPIAVGTRELLREISAHVSDPRRSVPVAVELAEKADSARRSAKELARSVLARAEQRESKSVVATHPPACPLAIWRVVAPTSAGIDNGNLNLSEGDSRDSQGIRPACLARAEEVRAALDDAILLKPELEAIRARADELSLELTSKGKELNVASSKRIQLEALVEKAELSQATSTELQEQLHRLQSTSRKVEQENKFMAEALEDLQDSTSRLEAENRTLRMGGSPGGRSAQSASAASGKLSRMRSIPSSMRIVGSEGQPSPDAQAKREVVLGSATSGDGTAETLSKALTWSQAEVARWRGEAFAQALWSLHPLPGFPSTRTSQARSDLHVTGKAEIENPGVVSQGAAKSLEELLSLSKKLAAVRRAPRVVRLAKDCALRDYCILVSNGSVEKTTDELCASLRRCVGDVRKEARGLSAKLRQYFCLCRRQHPQSLQIAAAANCAWQDWK